MQNSAGPAVVGLLLAVASVSADTLCVSSASTNATAPFLTWASAATNLQHAIDAAVAGDEIVVSDGTYGPVKVDKPLLLRSVNGPKVTIIDAQRQRRCVYLAGGASLTGFGIKQGIADIGGGVLCAFSDVFLTNCIIIENVCTNSDVPGSGSGAGVYGGTLFNCVLARNFTAVSGGGAMGAVLYNCTVAGNHAAQYGGGVHSSAAANCIVYSNTAVRAFPNYALSSLDNCCTTPMPTNGVRNITGAPLFVNYGAGDLRLLATSPCIDAGERSFVGTSMDLAGNSRIIRRTVDIGAYEFPGTNAFEFYAWVQHHGVLIDGTEDYLDPDGDGMNNWQEWVCYTCPTNSLKFLHIASVVPAGPNLVVTWETSPGVKYLIERSTNASSGFTLLASDLLPQTGQMVYTDSNVPGTGPFFYRVGVRPPP